MPCCVPASPRPTGRGGDPLESPPPDVLLLYHQATPAHTWGWCITQTGRVWYFEDKVPVVDRAKRTVKFVPARKEWHRTDEVLTWGELERVRGELRWGGFMELPAEIVPDHGIMGGVDVWWVATLDGRTQTVHYTGGSHRPIDVIQRIEDLARDLKYCAIGRWRRASGLP